MEVVDSWNGQKATALRKALRMTIEGFADKLGTVARNVAKWNGNPNMEPETVMQQALDTVLYQAEPPVQARFALILGKAEEEAAVPAETRAEAERTLAAEVGIEPAIEWLDHHSGSEPGTSRREVLDALADIDTNELRRRGNQRGRVTRSDLARGIAEYYGDDTCTYAAEFGDAGSARTTVLTRAEWLDLACRLNGDGDSLTLADDVPDLNVELDGPTHAAAIRRIAEGVAVGAKIVDSPTYRLVDVDPRPGRLAGRFGLTTFAQYALTMDLLEAELTDALAAGEPVKPGTLPLRGRYLPDLATARNVGERVCAGGALALLAIARPAAGSRPADYLLLVQERSGRVLNAARRLAVIPKCFHQPISDYRADTGIGATLQREMEEELFGRDDVDIVAGSLRAAAPMHPSRLSEPMRWLHDASEPEQWQMECTGFGLNLVSGNYEFPSIIAIHDEEFWHRFGGDIVANWEADNLRQYSSRDRAMVARLLADETWSNEGLFAFVQGIRRLAEVGGDRVDLPTVEVETPQ